MNKIKQRLFVLVMIIFISLSYAELTTANVLEEISASLNSFNFFQGGMTEFACETGDFTALPTGNLATANYYYSRYGVSNNYSAKIEYQGIWEKTYKVVNGSYYASTPSGDYYVRSLDELLSTTMMPGFETYIIDNLFVNTFNYISTGNIIITADYTVSADFKSVVLVVSQNRLEKIDFYNAAGGLTRSLCLQYVQQNGLFFLKRCALVYPGIISITIKDFSVINDNSVNNDEYSLISAESASNDTPPEDPDPFPIGSQAKYEEGGKLTPFASYGAAGEDVPGQSGALQLGYTDLVLPGKNGLDVTVRRSYLSQQFKSNPKPTSFSEDPFNVRYSARKFLDEYNLVMPDSWGGWMGKGWQTSIGGELYVNEINVFMMSGPYMGPTEVSQVKSVTVRNYTMQTADGYRGDFGTEFEDEIKGSTAEGAITQVAMAFYPLPGGITGLTALIIARNNNMMNAEKMFEMRRYLEQTGKLETAPKIFKSRDKREKMKIEIIDDDHYVVFLPDGKKYHFTQKIFNKESSWYKDAYFSSIMGISRGFLGYQYRSRIYYLTKIEDVHNNAVNIQYEQLFSEESKNGGYAAMDYNAKVDTKEFVQTALSLYSAVPEGETIEAAEFAANMNKALSNLSSADGLSKIAFDKDARESITMSDYASSTLISAITSIIITAISGIIAVIPPGPAGLFMREILAVVISLMFSISTDDATMAYKAKYEISGWRPCRIVDTLNRNIDVTYRSSNDPNTIQDSQINKISYKGPNGENNELIYTYDSNDLLVRVDYPAGNPITYEYEYKNQEINDKDIHDKGWLLTAINHPSGFRSEYTYKWFQPKRDVTTVLQPSDAENKRWSYYIVSKKIHSGTGVDQRAWNYEYRDGVPYSLYPSRDDSVSRRWYFKRHKIIDPLVQETKKDYIIGMLESIHYPTINANSNEWRTHHTLLNEYDLAGQTYLLKHQMVLKNTSMQEKFFEYDDYGQLKKLTDMGFSNEDDPIDQRITYIDYDDSLHHADDAPNIYGLVEEQWIEEPSKNAGIKYQHVWRDYDNSNGELLIERKYYSASNYVEDNYAYDAYGNMILHTDPLGVQTNITYQYDAYPQTETKVVDGKTFQTEKTFSQWTGALFSERDENNYLKSYSYDKLGRKIKETHPDATFVQTNYLDSQYRTEVTDRKLRKTIYNYNPFGELKTITDPLNNTTTYMTDKLGRLKTITLADNRQYNYTYDEIGRPIRITYPDGTYSRKAYEDGNNAILVWDENDHGMEYHYSAQGNLLKVVRGDIQEAGTIHYEYDFSSLKKIITPLDYEITFENDLLGRRIKKTQPNGDFESFVYDNNGNLTLHTNYENKPIGFVYDGLNRIKEENYQDSNYDVTYTYDQGGAAQYALGRLTLVADNSGTTQFKYNNLGLITEETKTLEGISYITKYFYDNTGLLTSIEYPPVNGKTIKINYTYDALDRLDQVKMQVNGGVEQTLVDNTFDNVGRLTLKNYSSGIKENYSYDQKDRLIEHQTRKSNNNLIFNYNYKYDYAGNIVQRDITDDNVLRRRDSYEYDYINQLKKVDVPGNKDIVLEYDRHFNRNSMIHGFGTITYNYNVEMNYLTEYKEDTNNDGLYELSVQYDYSKQGNPKYKAYKDSALNKEAARETYTWNDRDELMKIEGRVTENYTYDYRGLRHKKVYRGKN